MSQRKFIDLTGRVFGRLQVIERVENKTLSCGRSVHMWMCLCECGNKKIVSGNALRNGHTKSCGCLHKEKAPLNNKNKKKYNTYNFTKGYGVGYTSKGEEFLFDVEDYDKIKNYYWISHTGYIETQISKSRKHLFLHTLVMNPPNGMIIDHINHNTYDNRKKNLRIVTFSQNSFNRKIQENNTSGVTGISYKKNCNKWVSYIKVNKKLIHLGYFKDINDAIKARKEAEEKYFGEYSYDNSMKGDENYE